MHEVRWLEEREKESGSVSAFEREGRLVDISVVEEELEEVEEDDEDEEEEEESSESCCWNEGSAA